MIVEIDMSQDLYERLKRMADSDHIPVQYAIIQRLARSIQAENSRQVAPVDADIEDGVTAYIARVPAPFTNEEIITFGGWESNRTVERAVGVIMRSNGYVYKEVRAKDGNIRKWFKK